MDRPIQQRTGALLLVLGMTFGVVTIVRSGWVGSWLEVLEGLAIVAGAFLLTGGARAALWVRGLAVFLLAASVALTIAAPLFQPLDLTIAQIHLGPADFAVKAASMAIIVCVTLWVTRRLDHPAVRDAIARANIKHWGMVLPARAGAGIVALVSLLLWLTLHGQSGELATSLALQQLGPGYRYHLSWISSASNGHGKTITGTVVAWNDKEIRKVLLHWEIR